ncbi:MAG: hypothetical protein NDJ72_01750 [Elusimicrobia bacterium]|nr:hypothetical protein [Elusimicrobiota bacterium]
MARSGRSASKIRLLLSLSLLGSALPRSAAAQVPVAAFRLPAAAAVAPLAQLEAYGRELQLHLDGRRPARLDVVAAGLSTLEARLNAGVPPLQEPGKVRAELERVRVLLGRILARPVAAGPVAGRPVEGRPAAAAEDLLASVSPNAAASFFDGSRDRGAGSVFAPVRAAAAPAAPAVPPSRILATPTSHEAGVADLLRAGDAGARGTLALKIARELLAALRKPDADGASARQLGAFLRDIAEYRPADATGVRLSADGRNHFRLIFERADGGRRVILGQFLAGTSRDGKPARMAFIVMGAIEIDRNGEATQKHPGYWREYGDDGRRLDWSLVGETEEKGWGPWKRKDEVESSWATAKVWREGAWSVVSKEKVKTAVKEGQSWFGRTGEKVMKAPVVGPTLKFCDDVAASIYTSVIGAPQILLADLAGSDMYSLEAGGSYAKNPLVNLLADDRKHLDRLTPGARRTLYGKVDENRRRGLDASLVPLAPELRRQTLDAPVSDKEAVATLRDGYGASTYGKRMIAASADLDGWRSAAMKAGGVAAGTFEAVAEGVANPILWVTLGAGEAVVALKGSQALASGAIGAKAALTAVRGVQMGATAAWWGPWILSGTDNIGQVAQLTSEGKFDSAYYAKLGEAGADFLYMFVIP